jgi:hypothetical protein
MPLSMKESRSYDLVTEVLWYTNPHSPSAPFWRDILQIEKQPLSRMCDCATQWKHKIMTWSSSVAATVNVFKVHELLQSKHFENLLRTVQCVEPSDRIQNPYKIFISLPYNRIIPTYPTATKLKRVTGSPSHSQWKKSEEWSPFGLILITPYAIRHITHSTPTHTTWALTTH